MVLRVKKHYSKEATMILTKPKKKRVVSKSKYAAHLAKKTTFISGTVVFAIIGIGSNLFFFLFPVLVLVSLFLWSWKTTLSLLCLTILMRLVGKASMRAAMSLEKTAEGLEDVELMTTDKVKQLPLRETLVRASTEPTQEQEKVLLRAAITSEETASDQLLRPS
jgi:ABC-type protease/lipase transport system fused ATPase/permease subunit